MKTKRAIVSGNAGFIGRNFTQRLLRDGYMVQGFDIASPEEATRCDAIDFFSNNEGPVDLLIHAAANVGGRKAIDGDPLWIMRNVEIDRAAFNFAIKTKTPMIYFSSSAAYPIHLQTMAHWGSLVESMIKHDAEKFGVPDNTYGWSKLTGERMALIAREKGAQISIVRPFSGYGSDQSTDYPFGSFLAKAKDTNSTHFEIWGDGTQVRDWIHIDDIYNACQLMWREKIDGPINLSTGRPTDFNELAKTFMLAAHNIRPVKHILDAPKGVQYRVGDPTKLNEFYTPQITLEEGIIRAVTA